MSYPQPAHPSCPRRCVLCIGDRVRYRTEYLRLNNASESEYSRRGKVVKAAEGTLLFVVWDDGFGPQTMPCGQLQLVSVAEEV